jgi:hypothetical protein
VDKLLFPLLCPTVCLGARSQGSRSPQAESSSACPRAVAPVACTTSRSWEALLSGVHGILHRRGRADQPRNDQYKKRSRLLLIESADGPLVFQLLGRRQHDISGAAGDAHRGWSLGRPRRAYRAPSATRCRQARGQHPNSTQREIATRMAMSYRRFIRHQMLDMGPGVDDAQRPWSALHRYLAVRCGLDAVLSHQPPHRGKSRGGCSTAPCAENTLEP